MKLGNIVETFAKPIARGIDWVAGTDIEHCQGCQQRKETLNQLNDRLYDFFHQKSMKKKQERTKGE